MPESLPWKAEHVRFTCLFSSRDLVGLWEALAGSPPDSVTHDRKQGHVQESGEVDGGLLLTCISTVNRFDAILAPQPLGLQELMVLDDATSLLRTFAARAFELAERPSRLAFGTVLSSATSTREAGYAALDRLLPNLDLDGSFQDFLFQLNRPRPSRAVEGQQINRLSKWSVGSRQNLQFTVAGHGLVPVPAAPPVYACRLELDINSIDPETVAGGAATPLPSDKLMRLWEELESAAKEIAVKGDVK